MTASKFFGADKLSTNGVVGHSLGKPAARYPGAIATDSDLIIAVDRQQTQLAAPLNATDTSMTVNDASLIRPYNLLSIDGKIVKTTGPAAGNAVPIARGFDGTIPALHLAGATVSGLVDAFHHNTLVAEVQAIEQALGPNLSALSSSLTISSAAYRFAPQTPGGSLTPGANVITIAPVPPGINGSDIDHYLYISGGTGTAEAVKIIGGTAVAGAPSGTVIVQCANAHSGAWQIASASAGVSEAYTAIKATGGTILVPSGTGTVWAPIYIEAPGITIAGIGWNSVLQAGANAQILGGIIITSNAAIGFVLRDITLDGNRTNHGINDVVGQSMQSVLAISGSDTTIDRVQVCYGSAMGIFAGDSTVTPFHISIKNCYIHHNGGVTGPGSNWPTPGGYGLGIMTGGTYAPRGLSILNNRIEYNGNTVTSPGDSCALNLVNTECVVDGNYIRNNYNLSGGQVCVGTPSGSAGASYTTISHNVIIKEGTFLGDHTTGIEVNASYVAVIGNAINGCESGVYVEARASHIAILGNVVNGAQNGIYVVADPKPSIKHVLIQGNMLAGSLQGLTISTDAMYVTVIGNDVSETTGTNVPGWPLLTPDQHVEFFDNHGFNGNAASGDGGPVTVGASPFVYTAGVRPEMLYFRGGTITSIEKWSGGAGTGLILATSSPCTMRMSPNSQIAITYTAAPTMIKDIQ